MCGISPLFTTPPSTDVKWQGSVILSLVSFIHFSELNGQTNAQAHFLPLTFRFPCTTWQAIIDIHLEPSILTRCHLLDKLSRLLSFSAFSQLANWISFADYIQKEHSSGFTLLYLSLVVLVPSYLIWKCCCWCQSLIVSLLGKSVTNLTLNVTIKRYVNASASCVECSTFFCSLWCRSIERWCRDSCNDRSRRIQFSPILFHFQIILSSDTSGTKLLQPFFPSQSILQNRKLILHIFM